MARFVCESREEFLERLRGLVDAGADPQTIHVRMPFYVPEAMQILGERPDRLRFFPLVGGIAGFGSGLALTIYSVLSWPIIVGGKPIVSLPPFLLIGYLLTILFGAVGSFAGFLLLARLPSGRGLAADGEFPERFIIIVETGEGE
ncbi:MAG TPA: quinol:electron acceptor oxidoreductase subunit ActD [Desulfuromonadales bacterium]|nr:quinol:electron acceptor oxidoreductase subunit ActD [Desulfuromonadales bacterium]